MFQLLHIICLTSCLVDLDGLCRFHLGDTPHNLTDMILNAWLVELMGSSLVQIFLFKCQVLYQMQTIFPA